MIGPTLVNLVLVAGGVLVLLALALAVQVGRNDDRRGRAFDVAPPTLVSVSRRGLLRRRRAVWR